MLNGKNVEVGETVRFTMCSNWTFKQDSTHEVTHVSDMDQNGWFDIKVKGFKDWYSCLNFSKV